MSDRRRVKVDCGNIQHEISVPSDAMVLRCPDPTVLPDPAAAVRPSSLPAAVVRLKRPGAEGVGGGAT